jgi:endonuclease/exonuclease/phosphatase family metal-dependent hydrolase
MLDDNLARPGSLRVLTMNLFGQQGDWPARREVLVAGLRALRPDLVAFQEPVVSNDYDQVRDLLGPTWHIAHQSVGLPEGRDHDGTAIASRWPLEALHEVDLHVTPRTADFPCAAIAAVAQAPPPIGPILLVNHLPSWQLGFAYERELQAVIAARFIEGLVGTRALPVVLAGDFDADPDATSVRFWSGRHALGDISVCYRDAWERAHPDEPGETFTPRNPLMRDHDWPFRRIDYIFVRCGEHGGPTLDITACALAFNEPVNGVWASDHFGVVADLAVPVARGSW